MKPEEFINLMNETIQGLSKTVETMKPVLEILPGLTEQLNEKNNKLQQELTDEKVKSQGYLTMYSNESNAKNKLKEEYDELEKKYEDYKESSVSQTEYDAKVKALKEEHDLYREADDALSAKKDEVQELKQEVQKWQNRYVNAIPYKEKYEKEKEINESLKGKAQEEIRRLNEEVKSQREEIQNLKNIILGQKTINNKFSGENEKTQKAKSDKTLTSDKAVWDAVNYYLNNSNNSDCKVSMTWVMKQTGLSKQRIYDAVNNPKIDISKYMSNPKVVGWHSKSRGKFKEE